VIRRFLAGALVRLFGKRCPQHGIWFKSDFCPQHVRAMAVAQETHDLVSIEYTGIRREPIGERRRVA
jgi:hypothetical protein